MNKFLKITVAVLLVILLLAALLLQLFAPRYVQQTINRVDGGPYPPVSQQAAVLHNTLLLADLHADSLLWKRDLLARSDYSHVDFPRLQEGGVALQVLSVVTKSPQGLNYEHNDADAMDMIKLLAYVQAWPIATRNSLLQRALYQAAKLDDFIDRSAGEVVLIKTREDLLRWLAGRAEGSTAIATVLATEGSHALEGNVDNVARLYDAGFRMMSLQHFFDNRLGGSLHGRDKKGLTNFGREVVREIMARDIMLDLSHSSEQTVRDVLAMSDEPVLISHTGFKGHCDSPRNISDELMLEIASRGGIIGVGFWPAAVCGTSAEAIAGAIVYGVNLLGPDAVALGSDFDGGVTTGFDSSEMSQLTQALLDAGLDRQVIAKIMGLNTLRFMQQQLPAH